MAARHAGWGRRRRKLMETGGKASEKTNPALRNGLPADDGPEKTKPALWCDPAYLNPALTGGADWWGPEKTKPALWRNTACLRWLGMKKQSETVGPGALCVQLTGFEKTKPPGGRLHFRKNPNRCGPQPPACGGPDKAKPPRGAGVAACDDWSETATEGLRFRLRFICGSGLSMLTRDAGVALNLCAFRSG
jgi:hypothetical protein